MVPNSLSVASYFHKITIVSNSLIWNTNQYSLEIISFNFLLKHLFGNICCFNSFIGILKNLRSDKSFTQTAEINIKNKANSIQKACILNKLVCQHRTFSNFYAYEKIWLFKTSAFLLTTRSKVEKCKMKTLILNEQLQVYLVRFIFMISNIT